MVSLLMDMQEEEIKDKAARIEYAEQCLTTLKLELKVSCFFALLQKYDSMYVIL